MLSIYVSSPLDADDREFYISLHEGGFASLLEDIDNTDLLEKVRCSWFRENLYRKCDCLGHPVNASQIGVDDWRIADFMFTAPKSVSIQGCLSDDSERFLSAHDEAVKECLEILEEKYAAASHQREINTRNLLIFLVRHMSNRYKEMEIHSHALIFNETNGIDGNGYALSLEMLLKGEWLGKYYCSRLASKIQNLGYAIRETTNGFELEGYTDEQLLKLSVRSCEILKIIEKFK